MTPEQLKASILQYAIQGKLVEQRSEEGTAEELYKKIRERQPKLKQSKNDLIFAAMEFDIPETWKWVELNEIYDFVDYRGKTPHKINEGVFLVTASNIKQGYMDYTRKEYISIEEYETRKSRGITQKGDLLFTTEAPMGNIAVCDLDICSCGQRVITFKEYEEKTANEYLFMYFILSPAFQKQLIDNCTGTTAKGIKADKLKHLKLPLPPLQEQYRIITKIEELLSFVDRYATSYKKLEQFNAKFPEDMKKSILQYAIQGKLVEQRPEEGSAEDLYKQIQEEKQKLIKEGKIKKEKPLLEITEDEIPFDIPDNWKWVRFGNLVTVQNGYAYKSEETNKNGIGLPVIKSGNLMSLNVQLKTRNDYVENPSEKMLSSKIVKGDMLMCLSSQSDNPEPLGKTAIYEWSTPALLNQRVLKIRTCVDSTTSYLYYTINSEYFHYTVSHQGGGSAQANLKMEHVLGMLIPLPPLEEQHRIVAKIEELLPYCDQLIEKNNCDK